MPQAVEQLLRSQQTSDRVRAAAWDAVYSIDDDAQAEQALRQLPLSDDVRAQLWDHRGSYKQIQQIGPMTPMASHEPAPSDAKLARQQADADPGAYLLDTLKNVPSDAVEQGKGIANILTLPMRAPQMLVEAIANSYRDQPQGPTLGDRASEAAQVIPNLLSHYGQYLDPDQRALQVREHPVGTVLDVAGLTSAVRNAPAAGRSAVNVAKSGVRTAGKIAATPGVAETAGAIYGGMTGGPMGAVAGAVGGNTASRVVRGMQRAMRPGSAPPPPPVAEAPPLPPPRPRVRGSKAAAPTQSNTNTTPVYHGSPRPDLRSVSSNPQVRQYDNGTSPLGGFFTPDRAEAARYAGSGGRIYETTAVPANPYEMPYRDFARLQDPTRSASGASLPPEQWAARLEELKLESTALRRDLTAKGHDGVIVRNTKGEPIEIASFNDVAVSPVSSSERFSPSPAAPAPQVAQASPQSAQASPAGSTLSPQRIQNELGIAARRAGVKLSEPEYAQAETLVRHGRTPAEAVAEMSGQQGTAAPAPATPTASAPRVKLNAAELKEYARLLKAGKSHQDAVSVIEQQRDLAQRLGTPSSESVRSAVAERNATGRWPKDKP